MAAVAHKFPQTAAPAPVTAPLIKAVPMKDDPAPRVSAPPIFQMTTAPPLPTLIILNSLPAATVNAELRLIIQN